MAQTFGVPTHVVAGGEGASAGGTYSLGGTVGQAADVSNVSSGGTYAVAGGYWQTIDAPGTVVPFIDSGLTPGSNVIRAIHIIELRQRVDVLRARFGLIGFSWTDPTLTAGVTTARAVHFSELRDALSQAYLAGGLAAVVHGRRRRRRHDHRGQHHRTAERRPCARIVRCSRGCRRR